MVNIIVGDNAIGKTKVLYEKLDMEDVISNIRVDNNTMYCGYNLQMADSIAKLIGAGRVVYENNVVFKVTSIYGKEELLSNGMQNILDVVCRKGDILLLDEPDLDLSDREVGTLAYLIGTDTITDKFKEIWITTHNFRLLSIDNCVYYTIDNDSLTQISKEKAYEYTN